MQIEKRDGTKEKRYYDFISGMMEDAEKESKNPDTKKLTLHFPKKIIPSKKRK